MQQKPATMQGMQSSGRHHLHVRKRMYKKLEQYPHPDAFKRLFDKVMWVVAIGGPLAMLPQVTQVFETKDVTSLSLTTWILWLIFSVIWALYGILHRDMPIILSQVIYIILNSIVVLAILFYG